MVNVYRKTQKGKATEKKEEKWFVAPFVNMNEIELISAQNNTFW